MKRFVLCFVFCVAVIFGASAFYNYKYDTYGFFNTDFSVARYGVNQRFVKMRFLLENPSKYDAYCFGSSRVGHIDLTKIDDEHQYYNMTYPRGLPANWLEDVRLLLKHHVNVRQIMIGIDEFSFLEDPQEDKNKILERLPYSDTKMVESYLSILLRKPTKRLPPDDSRLLFYYDIFGTGRYFYCRLDEEIESDVETYIHEKQFQEMIVPNTAESWRLSHMDETIRVLQQLKNLAEGNGIEFIVFINPVHKIRYLCDDLRRFNEFKRKLAYVVDYYDFSEVNEITANNYYFYDVSHYRPMVGDMIVQRIFHPEKGADFGVFVTKDNVEEHLQRLDRQAVEAYRAVIWGYDGSQTGKATPDNTGAL